MSGKASMFVFKVQLRKGLILTIDSSVKMQDKLTVELAIDKTMIDPDKPIMMKLEELYRIITQLSSITYQYTKPTDER